jgi:hypothetical protein
MEKLNTQDLQNILALIGRANITGQEALMTAMLQQKIGQLIQAESAKPAEEVKEPKS